MKPNTVKDIPKPRSVQPVKSSSAKPQKSITLLYLLYSSVAENTYNSTPFVIDTVYFWYVMVWMIMPHKNYRNLGNVIL